MINLQQDLRPNGAFSWLQDEQTAASVVAELKPTHRRMAAAGGAELSGFWFLSSGPVGFFILLILLFIFLTSLCSDCNRRSFELKDPELDRNPSSLIRVVRLEEARENPMIDEIQSDEKEFRPDGGFIPWRSHLGAPQSHPDASSPPDSAHIYNNVDEGRSSSDTSSPAANQSEDPVAPPAADLNEHDKTSVYAQVSRKMKITDVPEETKVEEEEEGEEPSPPLPDRRTDMDG